MKEIVAIQILRFIAAMLVVIMHATQAINIRFGSQSYWEKGSVGVDIFFVISGFVMMLIGMNQQSASRFDNAWIFLKRRLIRVVPLYWFYTTLKLFVLLLFPLLAMRTVVEIPHLLTSFLFIPDVSPWGLVEPFLPVGWTLNFEMFFYMIFALAILFGISRLFFCMLIFSLFFIIKDVYPGHVISDFYGKSIVFEFLLGALVALASGFKFSGRLFVGALFFIVGLLLIFGFERRLADDRFLGWGIPSAFIVLGAVYVEPLLKNNYVAKLIAYLGDASYSVYLSHTFVVPAVAAGLVKLGIINFSIILVVQILLVFIVGMISYKFLEKPLTSYFRTIFH